MIGYHTTNMEGTLAYGDGRPVREGETLTVDCQPKLCKQGLHASPTILDCLPYFKGWRLWKVDVQGEIDPAATKFCGKSRTALKDYGDISKQIIEFAFWCAKRAKKHAKANAADYAAANYAANAADYLKERHIQELWLQKHIVKPTLGLKWY